MSEAYPDLKADAAFADLQHQLTATEDRIQAARRFYNNNVRDYNARVQSVPSNLIARLGGFELRQYFQIDDGGRAVRSPGRPLGPAALIRRACHPCPACRPRPFLVVVVVVGGAVVVVGRMVVVGRIVVVGCSTVVVVAVVGTVPPSEARSASTRAPTAEPAISTAAARRKATHHRRR